MTNECFLATMPSVAIPSFSIVVPALNEEGALAATLEQILQVTQKDFPNFEILIFDDASTDNTGRIADQYASRYPNIRAFHNPKTSGIGYSYKKGIEAATKEYYILIHGDNEISGALMKDMLGSAKKADFSISYIQDDSRPQARQTVSKCFTKLTNLFFGLQVRYYNGPTLIPLRLLKEISISTNGHAFMAEIIVRLVKRGYRYLEIGFQTRVREEGKSKAFRLKNIVSVLRGILRLWFSLTFFPHNAIPAKNTRRSS